MKKITLTLLLSLMAVAIFAQAPSKESVVVDYLGRSSGVRSSTRDLIRAAVLTSITNSGRLNVLDATNLQALQVSASSSADSEVQPNVDNVRQGAMVEAGGNYLITGSVTKVAAEKKKTDDGKIYYSGIINFTLNITDLATGNNIAAKDFSYSGLNAKTGSNADEAITRTIDYIPNSMKRFINDNFKLKTKIVQIHEEKKGKVTQVYINAGSAVGITKSQTFLMFVESEVAGIKKQTEIGRLTVESVDGEELTLCKLAKPSEEVMKYMNEGVEIKVVSDREKAGTAIAGGLKSFIK